MSAAGDRVTSAHDQVTIAITGATLGGPATVAADKGLATFSGLTLTQAGASVQLTATGNGLSATSSAFSVTAGAPVLAKSSMSPAPCKIATAATVPLAFAFKDAYGNALASTPISLSTPLAQATFSPASGSTSSGGAFNTNFSAATAGSAPISATLNGAALQFTPAFEAVDPPAPATIAFPGPVSGTVGANSGICVDSGFPFTTARFSAAAATGASFSVTAIGFTPRFGVTSDPPAPYVVVSNTAEWLLQPGPYLFTVQTTNPAGTYTGAGAAVAGNSATDPSDDPNQCGFRLIVVPGTYTGQVLSSDDCPYIDQNGPDGTVYDQFFFYSPRPCTVTLHTTAFDPYLFVVDPSTGNGFASGAGPNGDATVSPPGGCTAPGGGPVLIAPNAEALPGLGPYTLTITLTGPAPAALTVPSAGGAKPIALPANAGSALMQALKHRPSLKRGS